jgi:predicted nucleic acid-binding protein
MTYLDTSALIRAWRLKLVPAQITRAHSVAEFYATLTRGLTVTVQGVKTRVQFSPKVAVEGARTTFAAMKFQDLTGKQALAELDLAAKNNVQAANIHDWMHAAAAATAGCREIVTTNEKHFKSVTKLKLTDPAKFFAKS